MSTADVTLAVVDAGSMVANRAGAMERAIDEEARMRLLVARYVREQMTTDTDYGVIPGTEKPTLLKPGAEKLVALFHCEPSYRLISETEDFDRGLFAYKFRVRLKSEGGKVVAEGFGSANSREGRYRWRNANRKCPNCGKEAIFTSKNQGEGYYCWAKKGGCGAKFAKGAPAIESQEAGRVENDDVATLANTILKMAKKRALVDGAIALARCSDLFTQDVEDFVDAAPAEVVSAPATTIPPPEPPRTPKVVDSAQGVGVIAATVAAGDPTNGATFPFGKSKGQKVHGADKATLEYFANSARKELADQSKAKFHDKTRAQLQVYEAELNRQRAQ